MRLRREGSFDDDLARNYHPEVIVMTAREVFRGHEGVRQSAHRLWSAIEDPNAYVYDSVLVEDRFALLEWHARTEAIQVTSGVDSYLIESGRIRGQSIHYRVEDLELTMAGSALASGSAPGPRSDEDRARMPHLASGG